MCHAAAGLFVPKEAAIPTASSAQPEIGSYRVRIIPIECKGRGCCTTIISRMKNTEVVRLCVCVS